MNQPLVAIPGSDYAYSSLGYNLAGVALERAAGASLAELVGLHIAEPIGMESLQPDYQWLDIPHRAAGYDLDDVSGMVVLDSDTDVSWKLPSGGFISTAVDLTKWCSGLLGDVMVSPEQRDSVLWGPSSQSSYGLGFGVSGSSADRRINHSGSQQGARTAMVIYPEQNRCIVFMSNSRYFDAWDMMDVIEAALGQ